jgi:transcriptional regulator with XRE-family HTH domain
MSEFGEKLIKLRSGSKLALKEICQQAGIPPSRLVDLERSIRIPTPGQIELLENLSKINSGELAELAKSICKI